MTSLNYRYICNIILYLLNVSSLFFSGINSSEIIGNAKPITTNKTPLKSSPHDLPVVTSTAANSVSKNMTSSNAIKTVTFSEDKNPPPGKFLLLIRVENWFLFSYFLGSAQRRSDRLANNANKDTNKYYLNALEQGGSSSGNNLTDSAKRGKYF